MSRGARRRSAPAALGATALLLAGLTAGLLGAGAAPAAEAPDPAQAQPATLTIADVAPAAPRPADTFTLSGSLANAGPDALRDVTVSLRVSTAPLSSRGEIEQIAGGAPIARQTRPVPGAQRLAGEIAPGAAGAWELSVPMRRLDLPGNGVYLLQVTATGQGPAGLDAPDAGDELAAVSTFLPFLPQRGLYTPTEVSWLWPLAAEPSRDARGAFVDDSLARQLAPDGRLAELAAAPGNAPVTWMVDPELLESAQELAEPHRVYTDEARAAAAEAPAAAAPGDGGTERVQPDPAAARWLATLRADLTERPVAALPYADPDVAALTHQDYLSALDEALERSRTVTAARLARESDTTVAWPPDGCADEATLTALRDAGASTAVLSSDCVARAEALTYTPTGRARVPAGDGRIEVLVADQGLTDALSGDLAAPGAAALATQRFLADSAMTTLERPNAPQAVLVAPPRRWNPPPGMAEELLAAAAGAPWLRTVGLPALSTTPVPPEYAGAVAAYPEQAAERELRAAFVGDIRVAAREAARLDRVLAPLARPGGLADANAAALLRSASSVWRDQRDRGRDYVAGVTATIRADQGKVEVIGRSLVTLSDNRGTIPLTVSNELGQAVTVTPTLRPTVGSRLRVIDPEPVTIRAGRKQTVRIEAEASANGITRVEIQLLDATGRPFGPPTELAVNVTGYGTLGLIVVIAVGGTLLVAAVIRNVRRFRRSRSRHQPSPAAGSPGPDGAARASEKVQA